MNATRPLTTSERRSAHLCPHCHVLLEVAVIGNRYSVSYPADCPTKDKCAGRALDDAGLLVVADPRR